MFTSVTVYATSVHRAVQLNCTLWGARLSMRGAEICVPLSAAAMAPTTARLPALEARCCAQAVDLVLLRRLAGRYGGAIAGMLEKLLADAGSAPA